jgi:hypothetical protein
LIKYKFHLLHSTVLGFKELDHIIPAHTLAEAIRKFSRKHYLEAPAYWDEPFFDRDMELTFKNEYGEVRYKISW